MPTDRRKGANRGPPNRLRYPGGHPHIRGEGKSGAVPCPAPSRPALSCAALSCLRSVADLFRQRRQVIGIEALLREKGGAHHTPAKEAALQVHQRLDGGLRAVKLDEDADRFSGWEPRLRDLKDEHTVDLPVLGALLRHLVLQRLIHLARPHHVAQQHYRGGSPLEGHSAGLFGGGLLRRARRWRRGLRVDDDTGVGVRLLRHQRRDHPLLGAPQPLSLLPPHLGHHARRCAHAATATRGGRGPRGRGAQAQPGGEGRRGRHGRAATIAAAAARSRQAPAPQKRLLTADVKRGVP
mmetsp:Transcript_26698/g.67251  ORF Transcript_26698/g.67251 Transcript_26698/m.67251 type:complete len:295 (+) Transcript_26698:186-1070(+)